MGRRGLTGFGIALLAVCATGGALAEDVGQNEKIKVDPPAGRVGQRFTLTCIDFPEPAGRDIVYVVTAGSPEVDPDSPAGRQLKILWKDYAVNCYRNGGAFFGTAGPFAPGAYEVRFSTTLYNNDNRAEIATRTAFTVR